MNSLKKYGFDSFFNNITPNDLIARVIAQTAGIYEIMSDKGIIKAKVSGRFIYNVEANKDYPVVGDFVLYQKTEGSEIVNISRVLTRKNLFSRKMPISGGRKLYKGVIDGGITEEQVIAANIDYAMILCSLDKNFNIARLERYLILAKRSKLSIVVVLTKLDICPKYSPYLKIIQEVDSKLAVHAVSSLTGEGLGSLKKYIQPQKTVALLGSSGVGKSTLLNALFGNQIQKTSSISNHSGKGKHTTTLRKMFIHSNGCMIIDTPGIKEVQLWADKDDLRLVFNDIIELEKSCKYSNCSHSNEPHCAIRQALENGDLNVARYKRYMKMLKEVTRLSERKEEYCKKNSNRKRKNKY